MSEFEPPPDFQSSYAPNPRLIPGFTVTSHVIPAAYQRSSPESELVQTPVDGISKEKRVEQVRNAEVELRHLRSMEDTRVSAPGFTRALSLVANRYVNDAAPKSAPALFLLHANGFNKETWEPTILRLAHSVSEIWVWEAVNHGDSALLNKGKLNSLFHWEDGSRDLLNFLVNFLPTSVSPVPLPVLLPRVSTEESHRRLVNGFSDRKLTFVGHSFGGCTCVLAALRYPKLFYGGLILVDPVLVRPPWYKKDLEDRRSSFPLLRFTTSIPNPLALGALARRNTWKSREHAFSQFSQSPFFSVWDPEVLKLYVEYGIYESEPGVYKLKTDPLQEAILFSGTSTGSEKAWMYIIDLDENIEIRWVLPAEGKPEMGGPGASVHTIRLRPKNSSHVRIPDAGHLIAQEAPQALAEEIIKFLQRRFGLARL
ncbi:Alpha/Beta hydrolase protein [Mycena floridula]|nr:Alpha/Beta hydrolase protein [Mycena floridula]